MPQYILLFFFFCCFGPNLEKQALNLIYFSLFTVVSIVVVVICARHEMLLINFVLFHFRAAFNPRIFKREGSRRDYKPEGVSNFWLFSLTFYAVHVSHVACDFQLSSIGCQLLFSPEDN